MLKKDYLYWPNPASSPDFGICVAQCPSKNGGKVTPARVCTAVTGVSSDACWSTYDTTAVYHYCMPSNGSGNETAVKEIVSSGAFGRMVADLGKVCGRHCGRGLVSGADSTRVRVPRHGQCSLPRLSSRWCAASST